MAFTKVSDNGSGELFKFENEGDKIEGVYLGSYDHTGDFGPTKKHVIKTKDGVKCVFGQAHLTSLLSSIAPGSLIRATFESKKKGKRGNPMKVFLVEKDDSYVATAADLSSTNDDPSDYADEESAYDETTTSAVKSAVNSSAPNAAARAKVDALLKQNRRA